MLICLKDVITVRLPTFTPRKQKKVLRARTFFRQDGRVEKKKPRTRRPRWHNTWVRKEQMAQGPAADPLGLVADWDGLPPKHGVVDAGPSNAGGGLVGPAPAGAVASSSSGGGQVATTKPAPSVTERVSIELAHQTKQMSLKSGATMPAVVVYAGVKGDEKKTKASKKIFGRKPDSMPSAAAGAPPGPKAEESADKGPGPMELEVALGAGTH